MSIKVLAIFGLAGPPLGGLVAAAFEIPHLSFYKLAALLMVSYPVGIVPALATGVFAALVIKRLNAWQFLAASTLAGAISTIAFTAILSSKVEVVSYFSAMGAIAGLCCALICRVPPNNSFKPTPLRGAA